MTSVTDLGFHALHCGGMAICVECDRSFTPSSRHPACPACRSKDNCACGRTKQKKSKRCAACRVHGGPHNGAWKGGKVLHKAGYVMVHAPAHPRAQKRPYVFEHILVMENVLGRYLEPYENVHHRNGVRDDNRPENLELWTRPQPTGVRARDAVDWARTILELYADLPEGV